MLIRDSHASKLFIGLMSGTSLDGVDAALVSFDNNTCKITHTHFVAYPAQLREELLALHDYGHNELERCAILGNQLAHLYAEAVNQLLSHAEIASTEIMAIGCHGQTIRHRPELGFTLQIGNAALLAELTNITVVSDFRSRDIAAGGQGAPLVPAFHQAVFGHATLNRAVINIGGIANITYLPSDAMQNMPVIGFDTGPGNMLMDAWAALHIGKSYDASGKWAATGKVITPLLDKLMQASFFELPPPKSTGRDFFNLAWLNSMLQNDELAADVERTLLELTALSIAQATQRFCAHVDEIYLCGGGAHNDLLIERLQQLLHPVRIELSDALGIGVDWVEAAAFAWLAHQTMLQAPSNLPEVTGAKGLRILGAIYAS